MRDGGGMTFLQKYIITPVVGAAGVTVGFAYLQKKYKFFDLFDLRGSAAMKADGTQSETTRSDLVHIAGQLNQLSLRLTQLETRQVAREKFEKEWNDRFNSG